MKKTLCIFLSVLMALTLSIQAFAINSVDYTFNITSDGSNEIVVETGAIITVVYTISSSASTDNPSHAISSQNEIYYDSNFFQFVNRSATVANGFEESEHTRLNGDHLVYYNTSNSNYYNENGTVIGTFKLRVIATSGSSAIQNTGASVRTDGNEACNVQVNDLVVKIKGSDSASVTDVALNATSISLKVNESVQLSANITPSNATNKNVIWSSSNRAVAEADFDGKITAKSEGTAIITAKTVDGGKTATCTVTVVKEDLPIDEEIPPETEQPTEIPDEPVTSDTPSSNPFLDVKEGEYYYDAVLWAAENEITQGTGVKTFSPDMPVIRAQVVTFLWRAAGCPEPTGDASKFTDVEVGSYYEKAVAWAIEQGITKGTSETTFSPDKICTRGQIVTFLARFAGVEDDATGYTHSFTDVKATDFYNNAVAWAKDNGVTEGTSTTTFSPNDDCTRGQIVTFLYRWMVR